MTDRYALTLGASVASNTGGPYVTTWDRVVVPEAGTIRSVIGVASALTSNARTNSLDVYYQSDAPSAGSNTATSVLVDPITLVNNNDAVAGTVRQSGARVAAGGQLQLRTYADTGGTTPAFVNPRATVIVERDQ